MIVKTDIRIWLFTGFVILVIVITGFNIYLDSKLDSGVHVEKLQARNMELTEENNSMARQLASVAPSRQESERQAYIETVEKFMNVTMYQEKKGFEERKNQAQSIMNKELFEIFYPTPTFPYGDDYKSTPTDISYFLQSYNPNMEEVHVMVEFNISLLYNQKVEPERTNNVIKLTLNKQENKWIITDIQEIYMSII
ncbi:hypothetical protein [Bacillus sp. 37MA]|uniref:hypothetical protein n=1 Tax=Bacillus sp. 37MA TaxID=1132442 RepID=UPI00037C2CD4|nr:hypothetical protein [Bacillus sp. 37MA]